MSFYHSMLSQLGFPAYTEDINQELFDLLGSKMMMY